MSFDPFGNNKKVSTILGVVVALFLGSLLWAQCARGADLDFVVGSPVIRGPTAAMGLNVVWPRQIMDYADLSAGFMLISSSTDNGVQSSEQSIIHGQVITHLGPVDLGIGIARLQHADYYNSGVNNFSLSLQYLVWKHDGFRYQHFSNAGSDIPNLGRDLVTYVHRFGD